MSKHLFSTFDVTRQVFYSTAQSHAIVNLKPLLPGLIPKRVVPRLRDLRADEIGDLFVAVQRVGDAVEKAYHAGGLTVAVQDGAVAGQSVPHVHVHILPRHYSDYEGDKDKIYPALERSEQGLGDDLQAVNADAGVKGVGRDWEVRDEDRRPRSMEEMEKEANWLAGFL